MKKIKMILSLAALLVTLSGCANQEPQNNDSQTNNNIATEDIKDKSDSTTNDSKDTKDNNVAAQTDGDSINSNKSDSTNNDTSSQNTATETSKDQKSFYGNWQIKKILGYSKITTGGDKSLIGLKITLSKDLATLGNTSYDNPKYEITNKTANEIATSFRTTLLNIGVNDNSIDELDVLTKEGGYNMVFLIKDDNTLIYCFDGTFYETIRI